MRQFLHNLEILKFTSSTCVKSQRNCTPFSVLAKIWIAWVSSPVNWQNLVWQHWWPHQPNSLPHPQPKSKWKSRGSFQQGQWTDRHRELWGCSPKFCTMQRPILSETGTSPEENNERSLEWLHVCGMKPLMFLFLQIEHHFPQIGPSMTPCWSCLYSR